MNRFACAFVALAATIALFAGRGIVARADAAPRGAPAAAAPPAPPPSTTPHYRLVGLSPNTARLEGPGPYPGRSFDVYFTNGSVPTASRVVDNFWARIIEILIYGDLKE